jgi:hypothetical protein
MEPSPLLDVIKKNDTWRGGTLRVPFFSPQGRFRFHVRRVQEAIAEANRLWDSAGEILDEHSYEEGVGAIDPDGHHDHLGRSIDDALMWCGEILGE